MGPAAVPYEKSKKKGRDPMMSESKKLGTRSAIAGEVLALFQQRGRSNYGAEAVTQQEHALQAATFAERDGAAPALIVAALLHDVGHLLHDLPDDAPEQGVDDRHEVLAGPWLRARFDREVWEPVVLHVEAKRYLCAVEPDYADALSPPSVLSLKLQGGPMAADEISRFEKRQCFRDAVRLRRWDDEAKVVDLATPTLEHFVEYLEKCGAATD
jgi:phosphonate degradation associated HDIG domain protein